MKYIIANANANVLQKLHMSCKELFSKQSIPVCYKLTLSPPSTYSPFKFVQQSLLICHDSPETLDLGKKLIVQKRLWVASETNDLILSSFIPKIHRCEAKFLHITRQKLSTNEFQFLTMHGFVEELILFDVRVLDDAGQPLPMEEMLKMVLNIRILEASNAIYTSKTAQVLSEIPFKNKIQRFILWYVDDVRVDSESFSKFIKKSMAKDREIKFVSSNNVFLYDDFPDIKFQDFLWPQKL